MADSCQFVNKNVQSLIEGIEEWAGKNKTRFFFKDPYEAALKLVESEFGAPLEDMIYNRDMTKGQVGSFKSRLGELNNMVEKGQMGNKFSQVFWQTSHMGKKDPIVGSVLRNMSRSTFYQSEGTLRHGNIVKAMMKAVEAEASERGWKSKLGIRSAKKQMEDLDYRWRQAIADWQNNVKGADVKLSEVRKEMDNLVKDTFYEVHNDMLNMIENRDTGIPAILKKVYEKKSVNKKWKKDVDEGKRRVKLTKDDLANLRMSNGEPISNNMYEAMTHYMNLTNDLYATLRRGIAKRVDSIAHKIARNGDKNSAEELKDIKKKLIAELMPRYEDGYFPHYSRDMHIPFMDGLMADFQDMQNTANQYKKGSRSIGDIINSINTHITDHAKGRKTVEDGNAQFDYNRNLFSVMNNYVFDVNRFNYISFMDAHMIEGLTAIEKIYKTDGNAKGYGESITNYITDMHKAANGNLEMSPTTRNVMRSLLSFEFISKLGFNPRGAARNAFQRLLDYVNWGPVMVKNSKEYLKTIETPGETDSYIESVLRKTGLLYQEAVPELTESALQTPASIFKTVQYNNDTGKFEATKKPRLEKVADVMSNLAAKSSILHRTAENSNRKHTFKIAYAQLHKWLNNPEYRKRLKEEAEATESGKEKLEKGRDAISSSQIDAKIRQKAENFAINMVVMNHFDYADYAKSRLLRNKYGRVLGQFQHYSFEFLERNIQIAREAKHDILAGKLLPGDDAQGLAKASRMALLYFMAPAVASALTGVNFDNLVEHDTSQRIGQFATLLTGDEDEIKEAFYGKGPLLSTFGGPLTSDLIDIGMMMDLIELDDDGLLTLITGLENYDPNNQSTDISKKIRILNTFLGRFTERHLPQILEGRIGWAAQAELGLYPTAEARKKQRAAKQVLSDALTPEMEQALAMLSKS